MAIKYNLEQDVWFMLNNRPYKNEVRRIRQTKSIRMDYPLVCPHGQNLYDVDPIKTVVIETEYEIFNGAFVFMSEKDLFPTREDLVASLLRD